MRRILLSLAVVLSVGVLLYGVTNAAFSEPTQVFPNTVPLGVLGLEGIDVSQGVPASGGDDGHGHLLRGGALYSTAADNNLDLVFGGTRFNLRNYSGTLSSPLFVVDSDGKVGIGTTGPGYALDVVGDVRAEKYRGINSLVLDDYQTANPSSNVYLYSPPNDRDAWIYLDSADTGSNWGIYHRQIDSPSSVKGLPANSIGFIGGGNSALKAYITLDGGSGYFAGTVSVGHLRGLTLSGATTRNATFGAWPGYGSANGWLYLSNGDTSSPAYADLAVGSLSAASNFYVGGILPNYASWAAYGAGAGGAAIYNDDGSYKKLMIVGNNSAGGSRQVGIWDDLTVSGNTSAASFCLGGTCIDSWSDLEGILSIASLDTTPVDFCDSSSHCITVAVAEGSDDYGSWVKTSHKDTDSCNGDVMSPYNCGARTTTGSCHDVDHTTGLGGADCVLLGYCARTVTCYGSQFALTATSRW